MEAVATLTAPFSAARRRRPEPVGYGATMSRIRRHARRRRHRYADGYPRTGLADAAVRPRVPVVGRVSMDLVCVDVGAVPRDDVRVGDAVELFGPTVGIDEVAAAAGTISYEILTGLGRRPAREYIESE
jgi:alanine racemase